MRRARLLSLAAVLLCTPVLATATPATAQVGAQPDTDEAAALRIMITNDDGFDAPGIRILADRLTAAGHDVTIVAPLTNQSGTGTKMSAGSSVTVRHPRPKVWAVDGTPGDAVAFGLSVVFADKAPDLVVSGANFGTNIAGIATHSGTVGGAVAALEAGVPAFAVSTGGLSAPVFESTVNAMHPTSDFVAELIEHLRKRSHSARLLPEGVGLNINHPIVGEDGKGLAKGTAVTTQDKQQILKPNYTDSGNGTWKVSVTVDLRTPAMGSDVEALGADKVSLTPIAADWNTGPVDTAKTAGLLRGLRP
ncbi:5'/3'-nucleotidase SurE [Streptomyces sp. NPDC048623]|uniref:5'/3'-nucleotidase SurE n=1 Tax=Streptomyces sp. NPDC048623 TaxID=3155761 RepID=UPI0034170843